VKEMEDSEYEESVNQKERIKIEEDDEENSENDRDSKNEYD